MRHMFMNRERFITEHEVFTPRYHDKTDGEGEWICLIPCYKVNDGSEWQKLVFSKAKHLRGLRYCIYRPEIIKCSVTHVKSKKGYDVAMYEIPEHLWHTWDSETDVYNTAMELFPG